MRLLSAIILLTLSSCSCNWHIKQLNKKCSTWRNDTIKVTDTIFIPTVQRDTVFHYLQKDTVVIKKENLTLKYYFNQHDSTVYLSGKCDSILKFKVISVPYQKYDVKFDYSGYIKWVLIGLIVCVILYFLLRILK